MKVLALAQSFDETNGWGRYSAEIVRALRDLGVEIVPAAETGSPATPEFSGPPLSPSGEAQPSLKTAVLDVPRTLVAAHNCDIIHALDETKLALAASLSKLSGRPFVATLHGSHAMRLLQRRPRVYRTLLAEAGSLLTPSRYTAAQVAALAPAVAPKLHVAPLGVAVSPGQPIPPASVRSPFFLSVGAVKRRKGVLEAMTAVAALRRERPDFRLVVAGTYSPDDPYVRDVQKAAHALGTPGGLQLLGAVSPATLKGLFQTGRGLLMPSQNGPEGFEGFGLVHLEAASHGMPAIGSLGCGNEDAIQDGVTGFLIAQGDQASLVRATSRLAGDDGVWDRMSTSAAYFAATMSWRNTALSTLSAYKAAG